MRVGVELEKLRASARSDIVIDEIAQARALEKHLDVLRRRYPHLRTVQADLNTEWPFDQLALLDDARALAARQAELDERIAAARALRDERKHWLSTLLDQPSP